MAPSAENIRLLLVLVAMLLMMAMLPVPLEIVLLQFALVQVTAELALMVTWLEFKPATILEAVAESTMMSYGSISHIPPRPALIDAKSRTVLPEVSMKPPLEFVVLS